ncbi:MAG TPA: hypothetical protein PLG73_04700 [Candidatus Sumerlaeota bacterium]|nr:hypothetical protein [Candidatus Sumerlaeota bacterium]
MRSLLPTRPLGLLFLAGWLLAAPPLWAGLEDSATLDATPPGNLVGYPITNLVDNVDTSEWISDLSVGVGGGASVTFTWASPVAIGQVSIFWTSPYMPREYTVDTWDGSQWVTHFHVTDTPAAAAYANHAYGFPASTTALRINIVQSHEANYPRFGEVNILTASEVPPLTDLMDLPVTLESSTDPTNFQGKTLVLDNDVNTDWVSGLSVGVGGPATFTVTFPYAVKFSIVRIYWGFYPPEEFQVETWDEGAADWVVHDHITTAPLADDWTEHQDYYYAYHGDGNTMSGPDFPVETTKLRVNILVSSPDNFPRFSELEVLPDPTKVPAELSDFTLE